MKKKRLFIAGAIILLMIVAVLLIVYSASKGNKLSFEAIVQRTVIRPDGEVCLIVERTTEVYANPLNSLCISKDTVLCDVDDSEIYLEDFQLGDTVKVTLKNAFVEETPFYYPTVYEIKKIPAK